MTTSTDPTATNWKNVNNWHWVGKNCTPWTRTYFTDKLVGKEATQNGTKVTITSLTSLEGDVELNQRKGKMLTIFDIQLKLKWQGVLPDEKVIKGDINIPEVMYDTEPHEIVFDITADEDNKIAQQVKQVVRNMLIPALRMEFSKFSEDLITAHSHDVYIKSNDMNGHPTLSPYQPKQPVQEITRSSETQKSSLKGGVVTIKQSIEFVCSAQDLFETLVDMRKVQIWTRTSAKISKEAGSLFSLYGGNISGEIVEAIEHFKIVQKWQLKSWPENHYSEVTMTIKQGNGSVVLDLVQTGVPVGERDATDKNWHQHIWNPIKGTFGFGSVL